ncbi:MAG: oligoribonuclease [Galbitalea sp.]
MTDAEPTLAHGEEYIVIFSGGPNDGQTDHRIATADGWDKEIIVNGLESSAAAEFAYTASTVARVGDSVHVTYVWDPKDADDLEAVEERYDT